MKRIKIMLLSFALLAVVGGALAFEAKYGLQPYCTTFYEGGQTTQCVLTDAKVTNEDPSISVSTSTAQFIDNDWRCYTVNPQGLTFPVTCTDPKFITIEE